MEQNNAFLELLNYADGSPGAFPVKDGLCENNRPYSKVPMDERSGKIEPPWLCADSGEYEDYLYRRRKGMNNNMSW